MKLPIASKYILSKVDDYDYLCCFCNSFTKIIKYINIKDLDNFYDKECTNCEYFDNSCDGGSSVLVEGDCSQFNINEFKRELFIKVNVPTHVYIEKYKGDKYYTSYLMILDKGILKPLMFPNVHDYGEICFGKAYANSPALRYSNYWNSEFNDDLTDNDLIEDNEKLEDYLSNWSIESQDEIYDTNSYVLSDFINEDNYIESDNATDIYYIYN